LGRAEDGGTVPGGEGAEVEAGGGTKAEHDALVVEISPGKVFNIKLGGSLLHSFKISVKVTGIPLTGGAVIGVSPCPYSQVRSSVPITAVMAGVIAGTAEIGYLIMIKTCRAKMTAHAVIHGSTGFIIHRNNAVFLTKTVKRGILLI
jgi:hypothetical protein